MTPFWEQLLPCSWTSPQGQVKAQAANTASRRAWPHGAVTDSGVGRPRLGSHTSDHQPRLSFCFL